MNIVICENCKGDGVIEDNTINDIAFIVCSKCGGTGRLRNKTYTISVPFNTELGKFLEADEKIISIIRNLRNSSNV